MAEPTQPLHSTAVARRGPEGWRAVLITGRSGAGKSDLALRLLSRGWRLVGDDYVETSAIQGALFVTGPAALAGRIEARGLGLIAAAPIISARAVLVVQCQDQAAERLPEPETLPIRGIDLPLLKLDPRPASAVEIVAAAISRL